MANWIAGAIRHPGREKRRAKANGISTHAQLERDAKSNNRSLRAAGQLGLRLSAMHRHRTVAHGSK